MGIPELTNLERQPTTVPMLAAELDQAERRRAVVRPRKAARRICSGAVSSVSLRVHSGHGRAFS
jgi:hypothetical protein